MADWRRGIRHPHPPPTLDIGSGSPVLIMQGYAMQPRTYRRLAELLAALGCRVLVPSLFSQPGVTWSPPSVLARVRAELEATGVGPVTVIGHSFGGALELELAATHPELVTELVFADTLAMSREWTLAAEAVHPVHLLWMATPRAALDFTTSFATHPVCLVRAAWWGFRSDRRQAVATVAESGIPCHVLWAERDSLLSRSDGDQFARDLGADFTVVKGSDGPIDHDWVYRHPQLLVDALLSVGLKALTTPAADPDEAGPAAEARRA